MMVHGCHCRMAWERNLRTNDRAVSKIDGLVGHSGPVRADAARQWTKSAVGGSASFSERAGLHSRRKPASTGRVRGPTALPLSLAATGRLHREQHCLWKTLPVRRAL